MKRPYGSGQISSGWPGCSNDSQAFTHWRVVRIY